MLAKFGAMKNFGVEYLRSLAPLGMTGDLKNMERLLDFLGHPERKFQSVHVVGTDGKGSTAFYLSNILSAHGVSSGLYTSPHLVNVRERIRIDGNPVSEEDLDRLMREVRDASERLSVRVSFFEALTLACFLFFAERNVECAVVEAGLGGRLDSTRTACGSRAILTSIGLEHTELLGKTEEEILREKLGILSPNATLFVGQIGADLVRTAKNSVREILATLVVPDVVENLEVPNPGRHYVENASLSLAVAKDFLKERFDEKTARAALGKSLWAGRMQRLVDASGRFRWLLDGAHNPHAVRRLSEALVQHCPQEKFPCVFGALRDKSLEEMIALLKPHVSVWHVTRTSYERFREIEEVVAELKSLDCPVGTSAPLSAGFLKTVQAEAGDSPVLVTGSLYMIGGCIDLLKGEFDSLKFFRNMEMSESETH